MAFDTYPAVDEKNNFPEPVRKALANSEELNTRFSDTRTYAYDQSKKADWLKGTITTEVDLNTYMDVGVWRVSSTLPTNMPPLITPGTVSGYLIVTSVGSSSWGMQEFVRYGTYPERWWRISRNTTGTWGTWQRLLGSQLVPVPANSDLNDLNESGTYEVTTPNAAALITNLPVKTSGILENFKSSNGVIVQRFTTYGVEQDEWIRTSGSVTAKTLGPWTKKDRPEALGLANQLLREDFSYRRGGVKKVSTGVVSLRFDHGLANFNSKIRPVLERLKLPYSLALCSGQWARPENEGVTATMVNNWVKGGLAEIWNHTKNHGAGDSSEVQWREAIDLGLSELRTQLPAAQIDGFAIPGSAGTDFGGFTTGGTLEEFYNTAGGRHILSKHAVSSGYLNGAARVLDGVIRQGQGHYTLDAATLAGIKSRVSAAMTANQGYSMMLHPSLVDTEGYVTTAVVTSILEYLAAERDAGRLTVLGPYDMLLAEFDANIAARWDKGDTGTVDLDDFITSGYSAVVKSDSLNLPMASTGVLEVFKLGSSGITQRFTIYNSRTRVFIRHRSSTSWGAWNEPAWGPKTLNSNSDFNTTTAPGNYEVATTVYTNGPTTPARMGSLEVLAVVRAVVQRFTTFEAVPRTFVRTSAIDFTSWEPWIQIPGPAEVAAQTWILPTIAANDATADLNTLNTNGTTAVMNTNALNTPVPGKIGYLEMIRLSSNGIQRFTTYETQPRVFQRYRGSALTTWSAWSELGGDSSDVGSAVDLDSIIQPRTYSIGNGTNPNLPVAIIGTLEVLRVSKALIQRYTTWSPINVYIRRANVGNLTWTPWELQPNLKDLSELESSIAKNTTSIKALSAGGSSEKSGYKSAYLALNQASGSSVETISAASVRWPVTIGVTAQRARLHVRNWAWAYGTAASPYLYKGAVNFTGLWVGQGDGYRFKSEPTKVLSAFTTNAAADEYVSEWFAYEFAEDLQHLISVGYTNAEGQTNYQGRGGCWRNTNPSDAGVIAPSVSTSLTSPFDIWLELEVPSATPILAGFGDSNTVGTGTTLPVHDSWLSQYCRNNRAIPMHIANHGSNANSWSTDDTPRWTRFGNVASADALVYFLHQNDLAAGITTEVLKQRFKDILPIIRKHITPNIYGATITPGNKAENVDVIRKEFNTWLKSRPEGLLDCFDFAAAVSDDDLVIRPADSADGLHFKNTGHAKIAAELQKRPVTPRVLTRKEITRLLE